MVMGSARALPCLFLSLLLAALLTPLPAGGRRRPNDATATLRYDNCWAGYYTISVSYLCSIA